MYGLKKKRAGVSLLIGIVLIAIMTVFAMGVSSIVISALRNTSNVNNANIAFYAAEGALEKGLLDNQNMGSGYTTSTPASVSFNCQSGSGPCPTATVQVQGTVPLKTAIGSEFVIPTPGTGTAGTNCNPLTAVTTYFSYDDQGYPISNASALDHPCNWNKIRVGETVAIPLYVSSTKSACTVQDKSVPGYYVCNPVQLGLTSLKIKIRTPCKSGAVMCRATNRFDLNSTSSDPKAPFGGNDPIVSWQITATNLDGTVAYSLQPNVNTDYVTGSGWRSASAAIYESRINDKKFDGDFVALNSSDTKIAWDLIGGKGKIINFLKNITGSPPVEVNTWGLQTIYKPVLKLTIVHSLEDLTYKVSIPYLEYQITTNTGLTVEPTDTSQTITAEGLSGAFKQVLEVKQPQSSGLLEYVIQQ